MLTLLVMRHAKSSWDDPSKPDHDRPLNARGTQAAPRMGRLLREQGLVPDLIVSSTARRALDTAQAIVSATGYDGRIEEARRLYLAEPEGYLEVLGGLESRFRRVLLIGHNPGLAQLVALLSGVDAAMPTAAIAHIDADVERFADLRAGCGTLRAVHRPKEIE